MSLSDPPVNPRRKSTLTPYLWILPALAMAGTFMFYPITFSAVLSLFEWDGYQQDPFGNFVGLANFINLAQDPFFYMALRNTGLLVLSSITIQIIISFLLAAFIFMGSFSGATALKAIIFFPAVLSAVVISIVWRNLVFLRGGLIDLVTTALNLPAFYPLGDPDLAFYTIIIVSLWQSIGFGLVIFYAGLQSLESEIIESARLDGAGFWQLIYHIIAPLQKHVILIVAILNLIGGVQVFDIVFVLGGASTGALVQTHVVEVLASYMYFNSLRRGGPHSWGYSSSIAVVMMVIMLIFAIVRTRLHRPLD